MEVLSPFGHKLLFSEKHGYKNLFQDENLAQSSSILHHTFKRLGWSREARIKRREGKVLCLSEKEDCQ